MQLIVDIGDYETGRHMLDSEQGDILFRQLYTRTHVWNSSRWRIGSQCRMSRIVDELTYDMHIGSTELSRSSSDDK